MRDDPIPVALVLGARVRPDGTPSPTLRRRAEHGARLYQAGQVAAIVASGAVSTPGAPSEASIIARIVREAGVPGTALHLDEIARTTEENILCTRDLLLALGGKVLIVTDLWHGPRAQMVARRQGLDARVSAVPLRGARASFVLKASLRETAAFAGYWISGKGR